MTDYRTEKDSLGEVKVPANALYGAQTQRAIENFPVSGIRFPRVFIRSLGLIKAVAAEVNAGLGLLDANVAQAIHQAALEVADGTWDDHFPLDIFQTGSGTSTNMNANEVIASRATQLLGPAAKPVHPNNDVNKGQSSNDVIPAAIHVSAYLEVSEALLPALKHLHVTLKKRELECRGIVKTGRTHLMDAMPITLGQEISGWAFQVEQAMERIESTLAPAGKARHRRNCRGHRRQYAEGVRQNRLQQACRTHQTSFCGNGQPLRGTGNDGLGRGALGPAQDHGIVVHENGQRSPLDEQRPDRRARRDLAAGAPARIEHHARQGKPRDVRDDDDGRRPRSRATMRPSPSAISRGTSS